MKKLILRANTHREALFLIIASGHNTRNVLINKFKKSIDCNRSTAVKKVSWIAAQLEMKGAIVIREENKKDLYCLTKGVKLVDGVWYLIDKKEIE